MMPHTRARFQPRQTARRTTSQPNSTKPAQSQAQLARPVVPHPASSEALTGELPLFDPRPVDLQEVFLNRSPRLAIRVDTRDKRGQWMHKYVERKLPRKAPRQPYAIYLSSIFRRYRWLCFDLDDKRGPVGPDLATLLRWLDEAGLSFVVAASGSPGGRHVWVAARTLLEWTLVAAIAEAAAKRLPNLDHGLLKSSTGAARPIGAPHRNGGRSELLYPADSRRAADLLTPETCGNDSEAFTRLLLIIDAVPAPPDTRPKVSGSHVFSCVIDDELGPRLEGTPRTLLDDQTMALLSRRPPQDRVSEVCASVLTKLALRRWTWPMVLRLLTERRYREGGLLHVCTRPAGSGSLRIALDSDAAEDKLEEQWAKCVAFASRLPVPTQALEWHERIGDVVNLVVAIQQAADACPERWTCESGPADRAALDQLCLLALRAGSTVLDLDTRRAGLAVGHGSSTMSRAFRRLTLDGWLARRESTGRAATYELCPVDHEHPAFKPCGGGGPQGNPPPAGGDRLTLISSLELRLATLAADVFSHGRLGGLGHHTAQTYQALAAACPSKPVTAADVSERTGYSLGTTTRHLAKLKEVMLVGIAVMAVHHECPACEAVPGERCTVNGRQISRRGAEHQHRVRQELARERASRLHYRTRKGALVAAAKMLGVHGVVAGRARRYAAEIEQYHWWCREEEWMRTPKRGVRTGPQVHDEQTALILTTLPTQPRWRYPRTPDGRGDHAEARRRIARRIAVA